jgi:O-acetylhomoserine/O-acetylserine sulfhydrylase-like pyridoxal-dependent enzyme
MRAKRKDNIYTRWWNPTNQSVEAKLANLEETESALVFSSGTSAMSLAVNSERCLLRV